MTANRKPVAWCHGEIKTPPMSADARIKTGYLIGLLQEGETLTLPHSRSMKQVGRRCHELRIADGDSFWRVVYRVDDDAVVVFDVFQKKSNQTPKRVIETCKKRIKNYDAK